MLATMLATYEGHVLGSTGSLNQALILESTWLRTQTAGNPIASSHSCYTSLKSAAWVHA